MAEPRILVFVDWYRPGYKGGGPVRSIINLVEHMGRKVAFHIVTSDTDYTAAEPYPGIAPDQWTTLPTGERVWYASHNGRSWDSWRKLLASERWEAVYINGMYSWWYSILPLLLLRGTPQRRIVAPRGMLLSGPMAQGALKKTAFLRLARAVGLYRHVEFQATSGDEEATIRRFMGGTNKVHRVPNLPRRSTGSERPTRRKVPGEAHLVNVVRIATEKNIHLIVQCLQQVQGRVRFDLYGPVYHATYWAECQQAIERLPPNITFRYHGPIPTEQVPEVLAGDHHALFMPNQGDNYGHTMVEAMNAGLLLLISGNTPWRDLRRQQVGWDLSLEHTAPFIEALQELVDMDQDTFDQWSASAWNYGRRLVLDPIALERNLEMFGA